MRVPIDGAAGVGYLLRPGFDLPPLMFSVEEVEAIAVGLSLLERTADAGLAGAAQGVMRKISDVLPQDRSYGRISESVLTSGWHNIPASSVDPGLIRQSIRDERKLKIEYRDVHNASSTRVVLPVALLYYVDAQVVAAWCELRADYRHFRVDRIRQCETTDAFFAGRSAALRERWQQQQGPNA